MLNKRVTLLYPVRRRGETGEATAFRKGDTVWAAVDWSRGTRALSMGTVEAYDTIMVRLRWRADVDRWWRLLYDGRFFVIESCNKDMRANTIQVTASEIPAFGLVEEGRKANG